MKMTILPFALLAGVAQATESYPTDGPYPFGLTSDEIDAMLEHEFLLLNPGGDPAVGVSEDAKEWAKFQLTGSFECWKFGALCSLAGEAGAGQYLGAYVSLLRQLPTLAEYQAGMANLQTTYLNNPLTADRYYLDAPEVEQLELAWKDLYQLFGPPPLVPQPDFDDLMPGEVLPGPNSNNIPVLHVQAAWSPTLNYNLACAIGGWDDPSGWMANTSYSVGVDFAQQEYDASYGQWSNMLTMGNNVTGIGQNTLTICVDPLAVQLNILEVWEDSPDRRWVIEGEAVGGGQTATSTKILD